MVTVFVNIVAIKQTATSTGRPMSLSDKNLSDLKSLLLKQKTELHEADQTGEQAEEIVELDQTRVGRLSRMDALQAQAMSLETGRRRRKHLLDIGAALERINNNEYGECFECGELIKPARLAADPTATLCIGCAEALE
jgi:DnaK suppressor protein